MNKVDRWLLPDGIEEILPGQAIQTERLRRQLVDLFQSWGYDYVIPPMVEFTDSLLTGSGSDIDLLTFKLTDQLSGKTMGIRADITPQTARMDAHSLSREGVNRLCYAGHVMHTRPKTPLSSRTPLKVGVELFGEPGIDADVEVISLLIESLQVVNFPKQYLDLGHVGVFRALVEDAQLSDQEEESLFNLLQAKAITEIETWVEQTLENDEQKAWFSALPHLSGSLSILGKAREAFENAPAEVLAAIDELEAIAEQVSVRYPDAQLYFDLGELRGYHYHTGVVFGAYAPGVGNAIASGGRYDHIGEAFGRARPATGFDADLSAICRLIESGEEDTSGIFVNASDNEKLWQKIRELRQQGERVVVGLSGQTEPEIYQKCDRILVEEDGAFNLKQFNS